MDGCGDRRRDPLSTLRRLDPARPYKPLDVGNGIVSGTVSPAGRILSLGTSHPLYGRIVVTDAPPFDAALRHDQMAVRRYRAQLASPDRAGFGLASAAGPAEASLLDERWPVGRAGAVEVVTVAAPGRRGIVQRATGLQDGRVTTAPRIARAAYTQLTPGGALPAVDPRELGAFAMRAVSRDGAVYLAAAFGARPAEADAEVEALLRDAPGLVPDASGSGAIADIVTARATAYCLDCAASWLEDGSVAILADHEILPLVWTRDAYYVVRSLAATGAPGASAMTAAFLDWLFDRAERPGGWWPRAALASGQAKDPQFQLDQQLYPLLLAHQAGRHVAEARAVIERLLAKRGPCGLIATAETPADDPLSLPFHFSSHVLLWHVLALFEHPHAEPLRRVVRALFTRDGQFAYAVSGADGPARHYHDANDLPTIFAPGWGFCDAADPVWRATIDHAWSEANAGFVPGAFGGLGSLHTPHPWPLGDLQDLVVGRLLGDAARVRRAEARLRAVETWDGLLPEAYDERSGAVASRHWFAWPAALRALLGTDPRRVVP